MKTGYFDFDAEPGTGEGFTLRLNWMEKNGVVTLIEGSGVQLRTTEYAGPAWYPGGEIAINGVPLLEMDYNDNATHAFAVWSASDVFVDIDAINGQGLPVSSGKLATAKAVITVNVELYRNGSSPKPKFTGSAEIPLTIGLVQIQTAGGVKRHRVYAKQGGKIVPMAAVVKHGGSIKYCT